MSRREIVELGDPVLRERAREVTPEELRGDAVQKLIDDMIETMRAANGAGLAANQVGETLRSRWSRCGRTTRAIRTSRLCRSP